MLAEISFIVFYVGLHFTMTMTSQPTMTMTRPYLTVSKLKSSHMEGAFKNHVNSFHEKYIENSYMEWMWMIFVRFKVSYNLLTPKPLVYRTLRDIIVSHIALPEYV